MERRSGVRPDGFGGAGGEAGSVFGMVASAMGFSRTILLSAGVLEAARRGSAGSAAALAGGGFGSAASETVSGCDGEAFLERRASCSSRIWIRVASPERLTRRKMQIGSGRQTKRTAAKIRSDSIAKGKFFVEAGLSSEC